MSIFSKRVPPILLSYSYIPASRARVNGSGVAERDKFFALLKR